MLAYDGPEVSYVVVEVVADLVPGGFLARQRPGDAGKGIYIRVWLCNRGMMGFLSWDLSPAHLRKLLSIRLPHDATLRSA